MKQEHGETLGDYNKRFKQGRDNLKGIFGDKILNDYITKTDKYKAESDVDEKSELHKSSFEKWCTRAHLKNSDHNEHGTLKKNLQSQCTLDNDQCPSTVSEVTDVSTNHTWDEAHATASKKKKEQPTGGTTTASAAISTPSTADAVLIQKDLTPKEKEEKKKNTACFCCGEKGHFAPQCPKLDETPHKDWVIKSDKRTGVTWGAGVSGFQTGIQWLQTHNAQDKIRLVTTKLAFFGFL